MALFIVGEILRGERIKKGITQEDLAENICTVATLSRIESGKHIPSKGILNALFEKLGNVNYNLKMSYENGYDKEIDRLEKELLNSVQREDPEEVQVYLDEMKNQDMIYDILDKQYIETAELYLKIAENGLNEDIYDDLKKLLQYTCNISIDEDKWENYIFTQNEIVLLNFITEYLYKTNNNEKADEIRKNLLQKMWEVYLIKGVDFPFYDKMVREYTKVLEQKNNTEPERIELLQHLEYYYRRFGKYDEFGKIGYDKINIFMEFNKLEEAREELVASYYYLLAYGKDDEAQSLRDWAAETWKLIFKIKYVDRKQ